MQAAAAQGFGPKWMLRQRLGGPGEVFTFYSYKGGTGRSMSLVNCAGLIAQQLPSGARPLLLVDFDLEAPGLHRYLAPLMDGYVSDQQPGVLELFEALSQQVDGLLAQRGLKALDDESAAALVSGFDLAPYKRSVRLPGAAPQGPVVLELIVAGRFDPDYDARLQRFDWPGLYQRAPALFRAFSERLAGEHSFVFVDSRTGLSDTSGISTMLLPDVLVLVFTPNSQSLTGIEHLVRKAVDYRARSPDLRPLRVYPLASRVDNQVEHFRQVWRQGDPAHALFGAVTGYQPLFAGVFTALLAPQAADVLPRLGEYFDQVQVPHAADYAFGERLCFAQQSSGDSLSIRGAYELFLPWLVTGAQPWERPAERLQDLRGALWLRDAGVAEAPASDEAWPAWFDRVARVAEGEPLADVSPASVTADRRFDIALGSSLAQAYVGGFGLARPMLEAAAASYGDDSAPSLVPQAPAALLTLLHGEPPPPEAQADAAAWLEGLDKLMGRWQPLPREREAWLDALLPLATEWGLPELRWRAAAERDGAGSETALEAQFAAAQARERAGDAAGALALLENVVTNPLAGGLFSAVQSLLTQWRARARGNAVRRLPAIQDCDSTAWVSFARADNELWSDWVMQFTRELDRSLRARMRGMKLPPVASAGSELLAGSSIEEELSRQLGRCFSFILVVGDHAVESAWCQREAETFIDLYGPAAAERLYVVALTQDALQRVLQWPLWRKVMGVDQPLATRYYSHEQPDRPVPIYVESGIVSAGFQDSFLRLRDSLAQSIRASMTAPPAPTVRAASTPPLNRALVYIESNRDDLSLWESLGDTLRERWDRLQPLDIVPRTALRVRGLPLDLDLGPDLLADADGVLLLWSRKTPEVLLAQINRVERALPHGAEACPGFVAHLSPPQPAADEPVPALGWNVLRFVAAGTDVPAVHAGDAGALDRFLLRVKAHAMRRGRGAA